MHLQSLARQGDEVAQAELDAVPPLPSLAAYLWEHFAAIAVRRANYGFGPCRLSRAEIRQWEQDECITLELWERRAILALDDAWIASQHPDDKPKEETGGVQ